ncbi:MAG: response regulator [Methylococcales bacterium]|nr:response regulator [Methylococcales bacterium]
MNNVKTVLVVDDSRVSRMMSRQFILSRHPQWEIHEARCGEEAIELAQGLDPFLILIDVNMPGMGGIAAAEILRQLYPESNISMLTANVQDAIRERAISIGVGFLKKPITETLIQQLLASLGD